MRLLEVLRLEHVRWTMLAAHTGQGVVRATPCDEVELDLSALWSEPAAG